MSQIANELTNLFAPPREAPPSARPTAGDRDESPFVDELQNAAAGAQDGDAAVAAPPSNNDAADDPADDAERDATPSDGPQPPEAAGPAATESEDDAPPANQGADDDPDEQDTHAILDAVAAEAVEPPPAADAAPAASPAGDGAETDASATPTAALAVDPAAAPANANRQEGGRSQAAAPATATLPTAPTDGGQEGGAATPANQANQATPRDAAAAAGAPAPAAGVGDAAAPQTDSGSAGNGDQPSPAQQPSTDEAPTGQQPLAEAAPSEADAEALGGEQRVDQPAAAPPPADEGNPAPAASTAVAPARETSDPAGESAPGSPAGDPAPTAPAAERPESQPNATLTRIAAGRVDAPPEGRDEAGPRVDASRFVSRVSGAFRAAQERGGEVQLRLSPPELGVLQVKLTVAEGVLTASLETETTAARNAILDNLPALRERLAEQEIRIEKFDVDVRQEGRQGDAQDWSPGEQRDRPSPRTPRTEASTETRDGAAESITTPIVNPESNGINLVA